jgi:hypothetical protein
LEYILGDLQIGGARPHLAVVHKSWKGTAAAYSRIKGQFPIPDHLHRLIADLELASLAAVVTPRAETEVCAAALDKLLDSTVARAIKRSAVPQIRSSRHHQQGASQRPRLLDEHVGGHGDHGIVRGEEAAEGVEAVSDGFDGATITWRGKRTD